MLRNKEAGNILPDVMEAYIRKRGGEIDPQVEGRIRFAKAAIVSVLRSSGAKAEAQIAEPKSESDAAAESDAQADADAEPESLAKPKPKSESDAQAHADALPSAN